MRALSVVTTTDAAAQASGLELAKMGFYIRKAISFGPIRFNLSKGGIGVSMGVKGARIGTGPRGAYVHMGRHGLYYRQSLGGSSRHESPSSGAPSFQPTTKQVPLPNVETLVDSSSEEVLSRINSHISQRAVAPYFLVATVLVAALLAGVAAVLAPIIGALGIILTWMLHIGDIEKKTSPILYEMGVEAEKKFEAVRTACEDLAKSRRIWRVNCEQITADWKRNSGAGTLIGRSNLIVAQSNPPWITTNVPIWCINLGAVILYFFPGRLLVWDSKTYGAVSYDTLAVTFTPQKFIEDGNPPGDAEVVDHTWRYVSKKGGPDRRFANNKRLPVVLYGGLRLSSGSGMNILLHVSNMNLASHFAEVFNVHLRSINLPSVIGARLKSQYPGTTFSVYADQEGVVHIKWDGFPFSALVKVCLNSLFLEGAILPDLKYILDHVDQSPGQDSQSERNKTASHEPEGTSAGRKSAYATIGVHEGASMEEVTPAYHHMAQLYHPDKVAGLAHEFRELAEQRMKEINGAYEELKKS
jgi:Protein of unknown function (DUF4236)/DnaJ domain